MSAATIQPERVLRELGELWTTLGKGEHEQGVLRACAMTLVVLADAAEDPAEVGETLAALMKEHPSRAVVIRVDHSASLDARVLAQCWMPFGSRRQICCEQIEISAAPGDLPDLPPIVLPLAVADLPVIVWCRLPYEASEPFAALATKTIVDSSTHPALESLAAAASRGRLVADLAWTRLTRWRELVAQIFENSAYSGHIQCIETVRVTHGGSTRPNSALYIAAWLLDCFGTVGVRPRVFFDPAAEPLSGNLRRLELSGRDLSISIGRTDGPVAEVRVNSLASRTVFTRHTDYSALREELAITGRDAVFERALQGALRLAAENA